MQRVFQISTKRSISVRLVNHLSIAFTKDHEWVKFDASDVTGVTEMIVGITDHAQTQLGDISYPDFPSVGEKAVQGDVVMNLESVKAVGDIHMPISGIVTELNQLLEDTPNIVNESPQENGWLFKFKPDRPTDISKLMDKDAYKSYCEKL